MARARNIDHAGRVVDFGSTATDYDEYRPGFPDSFFARVASRGWLAQGLRALDLGTGTGSLALGLASAGLDVIGLDPSRTLLDVARRRARAANLEVRFVEGVAEATGMSDASFDLVTAGQCWWWFDEAAAMAEVRRVLAHSGRLMIANFCYVPLPGQVAERTEDLVIAHNPGWTKARETGVFPSQVEALDRAGMIDVESFCYVEPVRFSHGRWRGRMRACNGIGATLAPEAVAAFDHELAGLLAREFPGELTIPHRVFVATGVMA